MYREQSEELRNNVSKLQRQEILGDLHDQMRTRLEQDQENRQQEEYFNQMWMADMEAKAKREEADVKRKDEANRETLVFLRQQMAALEEKKQQEKRLVEEEALLMV